MLTVREQLITPLFREPCLCIKYFGIVNIYMTYKFGFGYFSELKIKRGNEDNSEIIFLNF